jgi:hypothetical protein
MSKENRVGAPTEGLGQTVTFAAGGSNGVPQLSAERLNMVRAGQEGDGRARITAQQIAIPDAREGTKIIEAVQRFGDAAFAPKIEEAKQEAFISGMHRVAAGEAVKEVVDEQPWYSQLFGPTPVVEGARSFASFTLVQAESAKIEAEMPELRKLSPVEFQKVLSKRLTSVSSGDNGTDLLVQQAFVKEMPGLMKAHTKEHIGYQQAQFAESVRTAQVSASSRYRATRQRYNPGAKETDILMGGYDGSFTDSNDMLEAEISFVQTFQPLPGVPKETHQKMTSKVVADLLSQNDLHAFGVLEKAGVIDDLGAENSKSLRDYADRVESRVRANMPQQLVDRLAAIKAMPSLYDEAGINDKLKLAVSRLNADYQRITGAREPLLQGSTAAELQTSLYQNQIRAERTIRESQAKAKDKALTEQERLAADERAKSEAASAFLMGQPKAVPADAARGGWDYLRALPPKQGQVAPLQVARVQSYEVHRDEQGQQSIRGAASKLIAAKDPAALESLYQSEYLPMVMANGGNEAVAKAYFGPTYDNVFSRYHSLRQGVTDGDMSLILAAGVGALEDNSPLQTAKDSIDAQGLKAVSELFGITTGRDKIAPHLQDDFWRMIKGRVQNMSGDLETNVQAAVADATAQGVEFAGGFFWNSNRNSLVEAVSKQNGAEVLSRADEIPDAINATFMRKAKELGLQEDTLQPIYNPRSKPGDPEVYLMGMDSEGKYRIVGIKAADVLLERKRGKADAAERARYGGAENPTKRQMPNILPGLTGPAKGPAFAPVKEGTPSIYR